MNVQRFFAPTARDALRRVKEALGADAIVLANRSVDGGVEILALPADAAAALARPEVAPPPAPVPTRPAFEAPVPRPVAMPADEADDYTVSLSAGARKAAAEKVWQPFAAKKVPESAMPPAQKPPLAARAAQAAAEFSSPRAGAKPAATALPDPVPQKAEAPQMSPQVMEELQAIRAMIERQLAGFAWGEMARQAPARTLLLGEMLDAGFSAQLARRLIDALPAETELAEGRTLLKNALGRELITLANDADLIDAGGVFALVGPTGVGKTTTTAKLAARCVVRHGADSLALLTTDGYRIGAHEQLRIYGRILGVPVHVVRDAGDLRRTLSELRHKHMVLIDTAGVGQKDRMVAEQAALLNSAGGVVRRLLLLNATSRGDTLDDVVRAYAGPDLVGCVVTKVDEAAALAPALDVMIRNGLECAYIANGQRVPEDLHLANRAWLLHRALRRTAEDAHTLHGNEAGLLMAASNAGRGKGLGENRV
ncbi:MAG: flagellar biosynthesis protein FlhF [Rhodocyclaceae bacterium]|nr:flagellar biosynthesis protein FlhF [Rhodocyclaceae bacterium]